MQWSGTRPGVPGPLVDGPVPQAPRLGAGLTHQGHVDSRAGRAVRDGPRGLLARMVQWADGVARRAAVEEVVAVARAGIGPAIGCRTRLVVQAVGDAVH